MRYKKFLFTDASIPRNTQWRRRRKEQLERLRLAHQLSVIESENSPAQDGPSTNGDNQLSVIESENSPAQDGPSTNGDNQELQRPGTSGLDCNFQNDQDETLSSHLQSTQDGAIDDEIDCTDNLSHQSIDDVESLEETDQQDRTTLPSNSASVLCDSNTSSSKADEFSEEDLSQYPCPCVKFTSGDVMLMCLVLGMRHNLTWDAQVDILKMFNTIYGEDKVEATKYTYFKRIEDAKADISYHIFCPECNLYISKRECLKGFVQCQNCEVDVSVSDTSNYFLSISLESQIQQLLKDSNVVNSILNYRFHRTKINVNALEDIYDGAEYKKYFNNGGVLSNPYNFSYSFFVDGISTGRATGKTLWPIYVTINELSPKDRGKYVLLAGLYVGPKDPNQNYFLLPFIKEANKMSTEGIAWTHNGELKTSKVLPLCAVVDSVARYQLMNFQAFNAYHGCTFCYQKQERTRRGPKYVIQTQKVEQRSVESTNQDLKIAFRNRGEHRSEDRHCRGVKGPSPLLQLLYFNFILGFVVDYMHAILLGVIRTHMNLMLESVRKKFWNGMEEDSLGMDHLISVIDERLMKIKPPSCITRIPRSFRDIKLWKASEWRSWLLFYCVPCLQGLLKDKHLVPLAMLSTATNLLLQKSVQKEEVAEAHKLYMTYMFYYQKNFGEEFMVYNIHLLSHVCRCVLNWGPLWTHNSFIYESQNRHLLQLYKSPSMVVLQIARKYLIYHSVPLLCKTLASNAYTLEFCENIMHRKLISFVRCDDNIILMGKGDLSNFNTEESECLKSFTGLAANQSKTYRRFVYRGMKFSTLSYCEDKKNNDCCVFLSNGNIVLLKHVVMMTNSTVILVVQKLSFHKRPILESNEVKYNQVLKVKRYDKIMCTTPSSISDQGIFMDTITGSFVCKMPFGCYGD